MENKINEIRKGKGITLKTLSEMTGLSVSYLSDVSNGKHIPSVLNGLAISKVLGEEVKLIFPLPNY